MILVDTSVWIDHLHATVAPLVDALEREEVVTHPFIIGELACGQLRHRDEMLDLLDALPLALVATDRETRQFIETHQMMREGVGYIDVHLLVSVMLTPAALLWTRDRKLRPIALRLGVAWQ